MILFNWIRKKAAKDIRIMILSEMAMLKFKQQRYCKPRKDRGDIEMFFHYQDKIKTLSDLKETIEERFSLK
jgi:hypothetical protein